MILSLEVEGYNRLDLSGIKSIKFNQFSAVTAFLGTNGSGKSSLLELLTPYPAEKSDFDKGGYVIIRVMKNNVIYRLESDFRKGAMYSFIVENNEENLNEGGTLTVQKQLVKDYFGITRMVHDLFIGKERFTNMSLKRRKDWFTLLCDCDYTYALGTYNRIKERYRDSTGAIKKQKQLLLNTSLTEEQNTESIENIQESILFHEESIATLNRQAPYKHEYADFHYNKELEDKLIKLNDEMLSLTKENNQFLKVRARSEMLSLGEDYMRSKRDELTGRVRLLEELISKNVDNYTALENEINNYHLQNDDTFLNQKKKLEELKQLVSHLTNTARRDYFNPEDISNASGKWEWLHDNAELTSIVFNLSSAGITKDIRERAEKVKEHLHSLRKDEHQNTITLNEIKTGLRIIEERKTKHKVTCPECQHEFIGGVDPNEEEKMNQSVTKISLSLSQLEKQITETEETLRVLHESILHLDAFNNVVRSNKEQLLPFIKALFKDDLLYHSPGEAPVILQDYILTCETRKRIDSSNTEILNLEEQIKNINIVDQKHIDEARKNNQATADFIQSQNEELSSLREEIKNYDYHLNISKNISICEEKLLSSLNSFQENKSNLFSKYIYDEVQKLIHNHREQISLLSKRAIEITNRESRIKMLNENIASLELEHESWKALEAALSPSDGAIAEGLLGYLKLFISRLNAFVARVWTYPLIVLPSKADEEGNIGELSYRFPMLVGDTRKERKDVGHGSSGIKEIIDLAFVRVAKKALGLDDYPLFLDEFGRTFDEKHKENALRMIDSITEEFKENQIFMVSHFYQQYSVMKDITYCIIKEDNIVIPPNNVNRYIEIVR